MKINTKNRKEQRNKWLFEEEKALVKLTKKYYTTTIILLLQTIKQNSRVIWGASGSYFSVNYAFLFPEFSDALRSGVLLTWTDCPSQSPRDGKGLTCKYLPMQTNQSRSHSPVTPFIHLP